MEVSGRVHRGGPGPVRRQDPSPSLRVRKGVYSQPAG